MKRTRHLFLYGVTMLLLVSCSKSLTDLGYDSRAINTNVHNENQAFSSFTKGVPPFYSYGGGYVTSNKSYNIYNVIADEDIDNLLKVYVNLRMNVLRELYSRMSARYFSKKDFDKEYATLCSPSVLQFALEFASSNNVGDIGGWQIFKPYPGLDNPEAQYKIAYKGDDWFEVVPVGDNEKVRLRVVLAGKTMRPVIVEVDNPHFGVSATTAPNTKVGKGYELKQKWSRNADNRYRRSSAYFDWLTSTISSSCRTKERNFVTDKSIVNFYERTVQERQHLLCDFYRDLSSKEFNKKKLSHKYNSWIYADVEKAIHAKMQRNDSPLGQWKAFGVGSNDVDVSYKGHNWFGVAEKADTANAVLVQMIYCGKKLQPMVIGLRNTAANIGIGEDLYTDRHASPGPPWIVRQ